MTKNWQKISAIVLIVIFQLAALDYCNIKDVFAINLISLVASIPIFIAYKKYVNLNNKLKCLNPIIILIGFIYIKWIHSFSIKIELFSMLLVGFLALQYAFLIGKTHK